MKEEHGLELEKIKAQERGELKEFREAAAVGGGRVVPLHRAGGTKGHSFRQLFDAVKGLNETIKNWKGGT
jgi:hypothetical protein